MRRVDPSVAVPGNTAGEQTIPVETSNTVNKVTVESATVHAARAGDNPDADRKATLGANTMESRIMDVASPASMVDQGTTLDDHVVESLIQYKAYRKAGGPRLSFSGDPLGAPSRTHQRALSEHIASPQAQLGSNHVVEGRQITSRCEEQIRLHESDAFPICVRCGHRHPPLHPTAGVMWSVPWIVREVWRITHPTEPQAAGVAVGMVAGRSLWSRRYNSRGLYAPLVAVASFLIGWLWRLEIVAWFPYGVAE
jgi:hypothetical protein